MNLRRALVKSIRTRGIATIGIGSLVLVSCAAPVAKISSNNLAENQETISNLIGQSSTNLTMELGPPSLQRIDGTAQVWLYHAQACQLNLILYPDQTGTPRAVTAVAHGDESQCIFGIQQKLVGTRPDAPHTAS